jgi:DNA-binding transcriptional MerR regulator
MRGRTALYGKRHLAQVVAIKRMQAAGRTLAEIATLLPQFDDTTLVHVSGVAVPRRAAPSPARPDFWRNAPAPRERPAPSPPPSSPKREVPAPLPPARVIKPRKRAAPRFSAQVVLEVAPGVTIAIDPGRTVSDADAEAIANAARPLVAELRRRHLISETRTAHEAHEEEQEPR